MRFALNYPDGWHRYAADAAKTVRSLAAHGLLEVSAETKQFRLARPGAAKPATPGEG